MKRFVLFICCLSGLAMANAQDKAVTTPASLEKPSLDLSSIKDWTSVGAEMISNDGKYISYTLFNQPAGKRITVIQTVNGNWKKELVNMSGTSFTEDSKYGIGRVGDSLVIIELGKGTASYIRNVSTYKISANGNWLAVQPATKTSDLLLFNAKGQQKFTIQSVNNYQLSPDEQQALLEVKNEKGFELKIFSLANGEVKSIYKSEKGEQLSNIANTGNGQFAFTIQKKEVNELWYYKRGENNPRLLISDQIVKEKFGEHMSIAVRQPEFNRNCDKIIFHITSEKKPQPNPGTVQVDVWSYLDEELQSIQLAKAQIPEVYKAICSIRDQKMFRLEQENEQIEGPINDMVLVRRSLGNYAEFESNWNRAAAFTYFLVSTIDGSRKMVKEKITHTSGRPGISPTGKWVVYYDFAANEYFSYEVSTGVTRNITKGAKATWIDKENDYPEPQTAWTPSRKTWLANDEAVMIYDTYDIWIVDPLGKKAPVNFTNKYGEKHHIKLELVDEGKPVMGDLSVEGKAAIYMRGANFDNKDRGFFVQRLGSNGDPETCTMGPYVYGWWEGYGEYNFPPVKAANSNTWLVMKMNAEEAPNLYVTPDFKKYTKLTNCQPHKKYNWYTTELHKWRSLDGKQLKGILYKPENFDSTKKYPVIIDCYEKRSDELNLFIWPKASEGRINIPMFVSNGYLVLTPDIIYNRGESGESAYKAVVSAARYLSKKPFIDETKMGIQGHSFGGYETNYIITRTNMFAAACSVSGFGDLISWYGSDARGSYAKYWAEKSQGRIGGTLWENPDAYIKNSPIMNADKITTPILLVNNKEDEIVPFAQGVELFTALRRLGKKVWMLQFDGEDHTLSRGKVAEDYHKRMTQFFDHYLKGTPAPKWMSKGIPAKQKGIDSGLESDTDKKEPGRGLTIDN